MAVPALLACFLVLFAPWAAVPAWAHPYLVQTQPGPGVALRDPPPLIQIGFTERVVLEGSSLRLDDGDGNPVALGPVHAPKEGPGLAADIKGTLGGDVYRVRWVVLGEDGHSSSGEFRFGVDGPGGVPPKHAESLSATGGPADQSAASDGPLRIALRWLGLLGASLLVGGAVLLTRLRGRLDEDVADTVSGRWGRLARPAWVLTLLGSIAAVLGAAGAGAGGTRLSILLATSTGGLALARLAGVVLAGLAGVVGRPGARRDQFLGMAGAFFLGAEAVGGHITAVTTAARIPAIVAQGAHLAAAAMWVGGLGVLAYAMAGVADALRPAAWRTAAAAYRPVAAISAVVVIATGVIASVREVQHRYFLLWSAYGRFLLVKWALVAAMLVLGGLAGRALGGRRTRGTITSGRRTRPVGGLLRTEAVLGAAVLVFAATLVGVAQGRGQPLPAQKGSVLAGPAFANAVVGGALVRMALSPAAPGRNRLTALLANPVEAATAGGVQRSASAPGEQEAVSVSLVCDCAAKPVAADLTRAAGAWRTDVELPTAGVWRASLKIGSGTSLAPVALRVATGSAPGASPYEISSIGDLSGAAARRCRSFQLGLVLSLGFLNAKGGVGGRKVLVRAGDDAGDPVQARKLAEHDTGAALAVPCGSTAAVTAGVLQKHMPVIVADGLAPPVNGERVFRLAGDPYAEGWAAGRTVARSGFVGRTDAPRRMAVVVEGSDPGGARAVAGVKAALALDPAEAEKVEGTKAPPTADVEVVARTHEPGTPLFPLVEDAANGDKYVAAFLAADPAALGPAIDQLTDLEIASSSALLVASRGFDEAFLRSSKIGRRGDVKIFGEVAPDSAESLLYTRLVFTIFPGEQPSIDGLRGYLAGKAIVAGLAGGSSVDDVAERLKLLNLFSDGVVSGWSPAAPAAGSWRFFLYKGSFIPAGLQPGAAPEAGRFFAEGGAWSRVATGNVGLCGPQLTVDGPPPPCTAPPKK
ncbi:MAG TPA: ABC transporter substrate-binding protein [Acidimicrobiia bacterium]|nr:ABC transporter substrate-binding protein [Acidimicrobiia bacterium]